MTRVSRTRQAVEDVEAIKAYVARDYERYAAPLAEGLVAEVERLAQFPQSGRIVPELAYESLREILHGPYRLVYRVGVDTVEIVTIYHGARLLRL